MRNISEADMALSFHNAAGKAIDPGLLLVSLICDERDKTVGYLMRKITSLNCNW